MRILINPDAHLGSGSLDNLSLAFLGEKNMIFCFIFFSPQIPVYDRKPSGWSHRTRSKKNKIKKGILFKWGGLFRDQVSSRWGIFKAKKTPKFKPSVMGKPPNPSSPHLEWDNFTQIPFFTPKMPFVYPWSTVCLSPALQLREEWLSRAWRVPWKWEKGWKMPRKMKIPRLPARSELRFPVYSPRVSFWHQKRVGFGEVWGVFFGFLIDFFLQRAERGSLCSAPDPSRAGKMGDNNISQEKGGLVGQEKQK